VATENGTTWRWAAGLSALVLTLAGCASTGCGPCVGGCALCGPPAVAECPGLFPVPIRPVFGPTKPEAETPAVPVAPERKGPPPVPLLPPPPEAVPAPPPADSARAASRKTAAKTGPSAAANSRNSSWVFAPPVAESVLRQMQPSVELKTDPTAKQPAESARR
jgi:hypothetical protein